MLPCQAAEQNSDAVAFRRGERPFDRSMEVHALPVAVLGFEPAPLLLNPTLNLAVESTSQTGVYDLVIRNSAGSATSAPVQVTVIVPAPFAFTMSRWSNEYWRMDFVTPVDVDRMDLESTTDFKTWNGVLTLKVHGPVQHYEKMDMSAPQRYYRLRRYP